MLYPKEDAVNSTLMFACRTCQFSEPATSSCIYRNELSTKIGATAGITQDIGEDPTVGEPPPLPVPDFCILCGGEIFCEICGSETDNGCFLEVEDEDVEMENTSPTANDLHESLNAAFDQAAQRMLASTLDGDSQHSAAASEAEQREERQPQVTQQ